MDSFETLLYEEDDGVAIVTLNRPEVRNAFNQKMQSELRELWRSLRVNDDVRVVVLTGAGEKAFRTGIGREESIEQGYLGDQEKREKMRGATGPVATPFQYNDPGEHQPQAERHVETGRGGRERHGVSSFVSLGTQFENIAGGQETFHMSRPEWRLR